MIIRQLHAENVLKYARLDLEDIPARGTIAVSGANESGKTAAVETICFALFGRTFSVDSNHLDKVIKWGETHCSVSLEFVSGDNQAYTIVRMLDANGMHSAVLRRGNDDEPLATGPDNVLEQVTDLCGFGYREYIDALYLAQREISQPRSQSSTIKAIAGGADLEAAAADIREDIADERRAAARIREEMTQLHTAKDDLEIRPGAIEALEDKQTGLRLEIKADQKEITGLQDAANGIQDACTRLQEVGGRYAMASLETTLGQWRAYSTELADAMGTLNNSCSALDTEHDLCVGDQLKEYLWEFEGRIAGFDPVQGRIDIYRSDLAGLLGEEMAVDAPDSEQVSLPKQMGQAKRSRRRVRFWGVIHEVLFLVCALGALAAWTGWWLLGNEGPDGLTATWLVENVSWWNETFLPWVQPAAIATSLVAVVFFGLALRLYKKSTGFKSRAAKLESTLADTRRRAGFIDGLADIPLPRALEDLRGLGVEPINQALNEFVRGPGTPLVAAGSLIEYQDRIVELLRHCAADMGNLRETIATETGALMQMIEERQLRIGHYDESIDAEQELIARAARFERQVAQLESDIDDHDDNIELFELAHSLADDTCRNIYTRFNQVLREYTGEVMPLLTEGRYEQMQINDALEVRVFSKDKNDFAELEEFSSGTQRQMLLAVRLAMSKALIEATGRGQQFLILDEPFAFFDRERIRHTLSALPNIDRDIAQIWIISQQFDADHPFDYHIACSRDADVLHVGSGATSGKAKRRARTTPEPA